MGFSMTNTTELLQTKIKDTPHLQPLRVRFYTALAWTAVFASVCLGLIFFAPQLWLPKLISATTVLYLAIQLHKQSSVWSEAAHSEYTTQSQNLLNMCRNSSHSTVKLWLETPNIQPWAQHVLQQYLKNYAAAAM